MVSIYPKVNGSVSDADIERETTAAHTADASVPVRTRAEESDSPWRCFSYSRKWLKRQMNRFIRRQGKKIADDDIGCKRGRKPLKGWEY